jgi:hypothetical protein
MGPRANPEGRFILETCKNNVPALGERDRHFLKPGCLQSVTGKTFNPSESGEHGSSFRLGGVGAAQVGSKIHSCQYAHAIGRENAAVIDSPLERSRTAIFQKGKEYLHPVEVSSWHFVQFG